MYLQRSLAQTKLSVLQLAFLMKRGFLFSQPRAASSAAQLASDSNAVRLASAIPCEAVLLIVGYVGAHNLETLWTCSQCNPYWYNWYCHECQDINRNLRWSPKFHFGHCGQSCGCCRSANGQRRLGLAHGQRRQWIGFPCEFCCDLWNLKRTCHTMKDLLKTYNGT